MATIVCTPPQIRADPSVRPVRPAHTVTARLRLTRRGRALLVLALVLVAFVAFSMMRIAPQAGTAFTGPATSTVTVHPGETLWQIARRVAPQDDVRDTVDRIRELNALDTTVVQAGQRLIVPG